VAQIAAGQHGVIRHVQLLWAGLDRNAITRRVKRGRLHRLYRGVYAVGHPGVSEMGARLAAVFACGSGAGLSHLHVASVWRVSRFACPALIDVVVPKQRDPGGAVRAHESRTLARRDIWTRCGIPVTSPARMYVDLTDCLTKFQLANVLHQSAFRGILHFPSVDDAIARNNGRKLSVLTQALELHRNGSAGTRSTAEDAFLRLVEGTLPEPVVNTPLEGEEVDFQWPGRRLVVEVDGGHHDRPTSRRDDVRKDAKLRAAGFTLLRVGADAVQSGECFGAVCRAFGSAPDF
jgi:Transcriptional regulator, AbiEi antitoxin/Protein of unknown function (DUF559)